MAPKNAAPSTKLVQPKTKRGRRILLKRAPKLVEDAKKALILCGHQTSQQIKDVLTDVHKLKAGDSVKYSRQNKDVKPFEPGGEASLEFFARKADCSLFALGSHTKKRPHNLVLGRLYDHHLYDAIEFGISDYRSMAQFGAAAAARTGYKPVIVFAGEKFESEPKLRVLRSVLLDFFRGLQVEQLNLAGVDRVMQAVALGNDRVLLRQFTIKFKKSGTKVPKVELSEMGPRMELAVRRVRQPGVELEKEATKQPRLTKKKEKNVGRDSLMGKVGRIYMPKQKIDSLALAKPKGLKRERRKAKAESVAEKAAAAIGVSGGGEGGSKRARTESAGKAAA